MAALMTCRNKSVFAGRCARAVYFVFSKTLSYTPARLITVII